MVLERSGEAGWEKHHDRNEKELSFRDRRNGEIVYVSHVGALHGSQAVPGFSLLLAA